MKATMFDARAVLMAIAAIACLAGVVHAETPQETPAARSLPPAAPEDRNYRIGTLDLLDIAVFQVDSMSRTVQVNGEGQIELPLIGTVSAAGKTPRELADDIAARFSGEGYLESPQVSVAVKESMHRKFTVGGAVKSPGNYPLQGQMSLVQAIAAAGGVEYEAKMRNVVIFRMVDQRRVATTIDLARVQSGKAGDPQVLAGDVIMVPVSAGKRTLRDFSTVLPFLYITTLFR